ncbi:MAG: hypothetical protein ACKN9D_04785 [Actinomycetales bacterium]
MALQLIRTTHAPVHIRVRAVQRIDALRRSRIPAEAALLVLATPNGYDSTINAATTTLTTLTRGLTATITRLQHATGICAPALAKTVERISPQAAARITTTWQHTTALTRLHTALARIGNHVRTAAHDPRTRHVATTSAAIARGLLALNKAFGANLRGWAATRGPITQRITNNAGNPWALLAIVATTVGITIGITAYQHATTPPVVTKPKRTRTTPSTNQQ